MLAVLVALSALSAPDAQPGLTVRDAQPGLRVGIVAGEPAGLSGIIGLPGPFALAIAVGYSSRDDAHALAVVDGLWLLPEIFGEVGEGRMVTYTGIGGRVSTRFDESHRGGVRVPFGIAYIFGEDSLELFAQVAPGLSWGGPRVEAIIGGGVGVRVSLHPR